MLLPSHTWKLEDSLWELVQGPEYWAQVKQQSILHSEPSVVQHIHYWSQDGWMDGCVSPGWMPTWYLPVLHTVILCALDCSCIWCGPLVLIEKIQEWDPCLSYLRASALFLLPTYVQSSQGHWKIKPGFWFLLYNLSLALSLWSPLTSLLSRPLLCFPVITHSLCGCHLCQKHIRIVTFSFHTEKGASPHIPWPYPSVNTACSKNIMVLCLESSLHSGLCCVLRFMSVSLWS